MGVTIPSEARGDVETVRRYINKRWEWYVGIAPIIYSEHSVQSLLKQSRLVAEWGSGRWDSGDVKLSPLSADLLDQRPEGGRFDPDETTHVIWEATVRINRLRRSPDFSGGKRF